MSHVKVTRSGIEEANKHLRALYLRVQELEKKVNDQHEAIMQKDEFMHSKITEVNESKDAEIINLRDQMKTQENKIALLESELKEMDKVRELLHSQETLGASLQHEADETKLLCITLETQHDENENTIFSLRAKLKEKDEQIDYLKKIERLLRNVADHIPDARSLVYAMEKASHVLKRPVFQNGTIHFPEEIQVEKSVKETDEIPECGADPLSEDPEQFSNLCSNNHSSSEIGVDLDAVENTSSLIVANCNAENTIDKQRGKEFYL